MVVTVCPYITCTILAVCLMLLENYTFKMYPQRKDLLQLMMDANAASEEKLDDGQMIGTAIGFLLGGYETTSSALSFASYLLALNPAIQDKLANEIHDYQETHPVSCFCW